MTPYILVTAVYIVSVFNVPLGVPLLHKYMYPDEASCLEYQRQFDDHYSNGPVPLPSTAGVAEWNTHGQSKCFTPEEFEETFGFTAVANE